jgi:hypothetical protein
MQAWSRVARRGFGAAAWASTTTAVRSAAVPAIASETGRTDIGLKRKQAPSERDRL